MSITVFTLIFVSFLSYCSASVAMSIPDGDLVLSKNSVVEVDGNSDSVDPEGRPIEYVFELLDEQDRVVMTKQGASATFDSLGNLSNGSHYRIQHYSKNNFSKSDSDEVGFFIESEDGAIDAWKNFLESHSENDCGGDIWSPNWNGVCIERINSTSLPTELFPKSHLDGDIEIQGQTLIGHPMPNINALSSVKSVDDILLSGVGLEDISGLRNIRESDQIRISGAQLITDFSPLRNIVADTLIITSINNPFDFTQFTGFSGVKRIGLSKRHSSDDAASQKLSVNDYLCKGESAGGGDAIWYTNGSTSSTSIKQVHICDCPDVNANNLCD